MRRGTAIAIVILSAVVFFLAVALARVGVELDNARIELQGLHHKRSEFSQDMTALLEANKKLSKDSKSLKEQIALQQETARQLRSELARFGSAMSNEKSR